MKKVLLTAAFAVAGMVGVSAQTSGVEGTVHVGIPVGSASDVSSFNVGVDLAYLHPLSNNFKLGAKVGYDHFIAKDYKFLGETYEGEDFGFIPLAATAKYEFGNNLFIGADLGYAFSTKDYIDGGLFWQPKFGYSGANFDVYAGYKGISIDNDHSDNTNVDAVSLGFAYKF
ncbi:porin family protein [Empedobacter falsenii]